MGKSLPLQLLFSLAALVLCSAVPSTLLAQEVVLNGGFESGTFSNWTVSDSSGFTVIGPDSLFSHSGTYHADLGARGILGSLSQALTTTPGMMYDLSFWLTSDSAVPPNEFDVFWNGSSILSLTDSSVFDYTQFTFSVAATGSSTTLEFRYRNDDDFFRLDDVSVMGVPEPSVIWFVLPSLAILFVAQRRAAKRC